MRRVTVYDSRTRSSRLFAPLHPPRVGLYVCGLTPYAPAHVGHGRTFVFFDVVARALRRWGYRVFYVQNVTNLDDKLIARAAEDDVEPLRLAERHFAGYLAAMHRLGVRSVNFYPFATDYVPEIIAQIATLVEKELAYRADDGSVYYEVAKFPRYGALSGQKIEQLRPGARLESDSRKRAQEDFVIWKAASPGEPSWESPWGPGRPGWHVEDTAITEHLLGVRYDLHGAGIDLIFPHHEAEVAIAEGASGLSPLANVWMHGGMLLLSGEKMSKSLGNILSLDDCLEQVGPGPLRLYYINAQYRSPIEFDPEKSLAEAKEAYQRLRGPLVRLDELLARDGEERPGEDAPGDLADAAAGLVERLDETLADDFNTREAIAALFTWTRRLSELGERLGRLSGAELTKLRAPYEWAREVLGLFDEAAAAPVAAWSALADVAIAARSRARGRGDFAEADRIRDELLRAGVVLEDGTSGTRWRAEPSK